MDNRTIIADELNLRTATTGLNFLSFVNPFPHNKTMQTSIDEQVKLARKYITLGLIPAAISTANDIVRKYRDDPRGWSLLSEINIATGKLINALENAEKSVALQPSYSPALTQLARCYLMAGQKKQAANTARKAASLDPKDAETLDALSSILTHCDEQKLALMLSTKAVALNPDNPWYLYNLATIQRMLGMLDEAEINCNRAIENNPDDFRAYHIRSDLRKQTKQNNHIEQLEKRLGAGVKQWRGEMMLNFALAKEKEDIEDYEGSFSHLKRACDLQRDHTNYRVEDDLDTMSRIILSHNRDALKSLSTGYDSNEPIFIVGLPRTGTTLVERIISSHSEVFAAGELQNFAAEIIKAVQGTGSKQQVGKTELVNRSLQVNMLQLGRAYVKSTQSLTGHTPHFIDKLPMNYLYCGLIHAALPNAKIIALNRNPMDACYAMYKMLFQGAYPFSYDLDELGKYYSAWRNLMQHWRKILGDSLYTVDYENLVEYPEKVSRQLIDFCGLQWEDTCLDYYKSDTPSSTASASQIRQPVYKSSINKWHKYRTQLQPLVDLFKKNNVDIN